MRFRARKAEKVSNDLTTPKQGSLVRRILMGLEDYLEAVSDTLGDAVTPGGGGSVGSGGSGSLATRIQHWWTVNGVIRTSTAIDGGWTVPTNCSILSVWLYRGTPGSSGSTVLDINRYRPSTGVSVSLYSTQANRPTIAFNDADSVVACTLPDVVALVSGDVVTVDCDTAEGGSPRNSKLTIEAA